MPTPPARWPAKCPAVGLLLLSWGCSLTPKPSEHALPLPAQTRVVLFIWDGLRPDSVNMDDTPNLVRLRDEGVLFEDSHATYPTLTMMNAASFATGGYADTNGFYGNDTWVAGPLDAGQTATGAPVDLQRPVFTEDYGVLDALDSFYGGRVLVTRTLFEAAQDAGVSTAAVGKVGAAYLQDRHRGGLLLEERLVWPRSLLLALRAHGLPIPFFAPLAYGEAVDKQGPNPTGPGPVVRLSDGVTPDPTRGLESPANADNAYLVKAFTEVLLPEFRPQLAVVWLRNPDSTEHPYGPGTAAERNALRAEDGLLGELLAALSRLGLSATTDVLVASDHAHSSVSGPQELFPLRGLADGGVTGLDATGYSVSGEVRTADLLNRAGLGLHAFDALGCVQAPVLSGILASGARVYPKAACNETAGTTLVPSVPASLGPKDVVVVANGGSEYLYVPSRDPQVVRTLLRFLQSREEYGALFLARRYGDVPGTLPLDAIHLETRSGARAPDVVVSFAFDADVQVQGVEGTEFNSLPANRGMHGSFSPRDVHNTLVASGPHFRRGFHDTLPTGNVDVAPTVARLLGLPLPDAQGRVLEEALLEGLPLERFVVETTLQTSTTVEGLRLLLPTDPDGHAVDAQRTRYRGELKRKTLRWEGRSATYVDWARAVRD
jgi:arylsulfatase A-like enzyme